MNISMNDNLNYHLKDDMACSPKKVNPIPYTLPPNLMAHRGGISKSLGSFLSDTRYQKILDKSNLRNRSVMPVFESTHHAHNISAILRTTEGLGYQDVSFVYPVEMRFRIGDGVDKGASVWLCARKTNSVEICAKALKSYGYKILIVSLPDFSRTSGHYQQKLRSFSAADFYSENFKEWLGNSPVALIFGNELHGIDPRWSPFADGYAHVQMSGFSESLNVSVCAAILLHQLKVSLPFKPLSINEREILVDFWVSRALENSLHLIEKANPNVLDYFEFIRKGNFYRPFDSLANTIG
jgi:tRNA (guanosine-2'-O-)-methyltransferase